ncbi:MAG: glycosyltransferase family 2 protein [Candidatus Odinarchaeota archaeon]
MKTLNYKEKPLFTSKDSVVKKSKENNFRYQELYSYLNQFKNKEKHVLVSIILPAYNEEISIRQILENLPIDESIEIIVIDDNSTDNSVREIEIVKKKKQIQLLKHKKNIGYGGAVITGIIHAKGDVIVTMDTDGQHNPLDMLSLIKPVFEEKAELTISSRYLGKNYYKLPLKTRLGEAIIEKFLTVFFGKRIMNNQNGFRAFNNVLAPIFKKAKNQGFAFATETIILTLIEGYRIIECPGNVYDRKYGDSKIKTLNLLLDLLFCFLRYSILKVLHIFIMRIKR